MKSNPNNTKNQETIFISGATGNIGNQLVKELNGKVPIKAGVHTPEKAAQLEQQGIETIPFNFYHPELMAHAFKGCKTLFLLSGESETFDRQVNIALQAAIDAGIHYVLRLSTMGINSLPNDPGMQMHRRAEDYVKFSGLGWTILKPNQFMDNIVDSQEKTILKHGRFYGAAGQGKISYVSSADVAACAAKILLNPEDHFGKTYRLTGPEALSNHQLAEILSGLLDQQVEYVNIGPEQLAEVLRANGMADWLIQCLVSMEVCIKQGKSSLVTDDVQQLLGRPPEHYQSFLYRELIEGNIENFEMAREKKQI